MLYLTGTPTSVKHLLDEHVIGYMNTPANRHKMNGWIWAADNGCYGKNYVGDDKWFAWLQSFTYRQRRQCLFATAPDVVGDAQQTIARSAPWLMKIRNAGFEPAFVAQDGLTVEATPWDDFDWLFIGGSTEWKLSADARQLMNAAKERYKRVHVGRVNSHKRFNAMEFLGADSVDGTFLAFGPDKNAPRLLSWIEESKRSAYLFDRHLL